MGAQPSQAAVRSRRSHRLHRHLERVAQRDVLREEAHAVVELVGDAARRRVEVHLVRARANHGIVDDQTP